MISIQIAAMIKKIIKDNTAGYIKPDKIYLYDIPEQINIEESLPIIKISHVTSNATTHSSNDINYTKERFQVQFFYDDEDENDYENMILELEDVFRENGIYYSTGFDSFDPDYDGVITITRQYNFRNKLR